MNSTTPATTGRTQATFHSIAQWVKLLLVVVISVIWFRIFILIFRLDSSIMGSSLMIISIAVLVVMLMLIVLAARLLSVSVVVFLGASLLLGSVSSISHTVLAAIVEYDQDRYYSIRCGDACLSDLDLFEEAGSPACLAGANAIFHYSQADEIEAAILQCKQPWLARQSKLDPLWLERMAYDKHGSVFWQTEMAFGHEPYQLREYVGKRDRLALLYVLPVLLIVEQFYQCILGIPVVVLIALLLIAATGPRMWYWRLGERLVDPKSSRWPDAVP